ncbi:nuclease-related domain-containing protein [Pseudanabaena galeata UHCC 0370]|uniref:Nuclease-related domain-containing protein n=1 Tax=Pseudanabaena galeata UHCC 0370 TaxID=3110310 RepID=A0ABU5TEJ1_9CYAN|nr:nuclease-related domain-containing protein [Pseudanabaena galeata]MEA5476693.1 nuclease-related domain-containing protein [Pseudanabaena galeata UHCC 0370]
MSKRGRRAGENIRELALKRRAKAVISFVGAGIVAFVPFLLIRTFENFLKQITSNNFSQPQSSLNIPPIFYVMFIIIALGLVVNGVFLWRRANDADQGARGEEEVSRELSQLEYEGWKIDYGIRLGNGLGDADIVCISPQDKAYVIDVKSHKGEVMVDGEQLHRRMGKTNYPFEKDFISQTMKQALQVGKQRSLKFVTPIIAFSEAKVSVPSNRLRKVYIVEKSRLVSFLKSLG